MYKQDCFEDNNNDHDTLGTPKSVHTYVRTSLDNLYFIVFPCKQESDIERLMLWKY